MLEVPQATSTAASAENTQAEAIQAGSQDDETQDAAGPMAAKVKNQAAEQAESTQNVTEGSTPEAPKAASIVGPAESNKTEAIQAGSQVDQTHDAAGPMVAKVKIPSSESEERVLYSIDDHVDYVPMPKFLHQEETGGGREATDKASAAE